MAPIVPAPASGIAAMIGDWLTQMQWLGNSGLAWLIAAGGALVGYMAAHSLALFLQSRLARRAERTKRIGAVVAAAVASATRGWLLLLIAITIALEFLHLGGASHGAPFSARWWLRLATGALIGIQVALWVTRLLVTWLNQAATRDGARPVNQVMLGIVTWAVQFVVWVTLILALLAAGDVNITAFVASLGIGGVAVALALQNVLTDLFSSIAIGLDKPFEPGDYIDFGTGQGTVARVGIKSTRIRSLSGEELAISNSVLLKEPIRNYSRMRERRVQFGLRLPFDTPRERIPEAIRRVRAIIENEHPTRFDRGNLRRFVEDGLDLEFVYYVLDPDFNKSAVIQEHINLAIMDAWHELGIEFALPARVLHEAAGGIGAAPGAPTTPR